MGGSRQEGFSLLEAIVSLAVLASVGMALFAAMAQSVQMAARAEAARERESALRNALAWMQTVNPAQVPNGEQRLGEVVLSWTSEPIEPPRDAMTGYFRAGLYSVGLYRVHLQLTRDGHAFAEMDLRRVGFEQVREPDVI